MWWAEHFQPRLSLRAEVLLISQSSSQNDICFIVAKAHSQTTLDALRCEFAQDLAHQVVDHITMDPNIAIVAVVGENMRGTPGVAGRTFHALGREGVNIIAIAQGSSETNISFVVSDESVKPALLATHREFGLQNTGVFRPLNLVHRLGLVRFLDMETVDTHDAKTRFSGLPRRVSEGEEIIIANRGVPVARMVFPLHESRSRMRGMYKGQIKIADDFDAPVADEIQNAFEEVNTESESCVAFLLHTNILLWYVLEPDRLSSAALKILAMDSERLCFSAASALEIDIKYSIGRLALPSAPVEFIPRLLE